jgi:hypothetical protein
VLKAVWNSIVKISFEFVHMSSPAIPSTCFLKTYRISKQLVTYLETLVAFSPYYLVAASDSRYESRTQGKIENFYRKALSLAWPSSATRTSRTRNSTGTSEGT